MALLAMVMAPFLAGFLTATSFLVFSGSSVGSRGGGASLGRSVSQVDPEIKGGKKQILAIGRHNYFGLYTSLASLVFSLCL